MNWPPDKGSENQFQSKTKKPRLFTPKPRVDFVKKGNGRDLRIQVFLDSGGYERAVDDRRFDPLFEFWRNLVSLDIKTSLLVYPLLKFFDREQLSRIAVN
jgi:hypothetical protein